jgi:hypothetical protein
MKSEIIGVRKMISCNDASMPLISYSLRGAERNVTRLPRYQNSSVDVVGLEFINGYTPQLN